MLSCNQGPILNLTYCNYNEEITIYAKTSAEDKNADILRVGINALYQLTNAMAFWSWMHQNNDLLLVTGFIAVAEP